MSDAPPFDTRLPDEEPAPERRGWVGYIEGVYHHYCRECGRFGPFGYDCWPGSPGRWYCREHRPGQVTARSP